METILPSKNNFFTSAAGACFIFSASSFIVTTSGRMMVLISSSFSCVVCCGLGLINAPLRFGSFLIFAAPSSISRSRPRSRFLSRLRSLNAAARCSLVNSFARSALMLLFSPLRPSRPPRLYEPRLLLYPESLSPSLLNPPRGPWEPPGLP